jgi:hypothetical protein
MKIKRNHYHGMDFHLSMIAIDNQLSSMSGNKHLSTVIEIVRLQFQGISHTVLRRKYNQWIAQGRPEKFICNDQRHYNKSQRALTDQGETLVTDHILNMNRDQQQVTYQVVRKIAIEQWSKENNCIHKNFSFDACDGWITHFISRHNLSSQLISRHSGSKQQPENENQCRLITEYKKEYHTFIEQYGIKNVYNFDETSFADLSGGRTIAQKRTVKKIDHMSSDTHRTDQPQVKNYVGSNQRVSIGCTITASGEKLKPIVNAKGSTDRCLRKYHSDNTDNCLMTKTASSWFREETMFNVLELIHQHSKGHESLCIWDSYKPHLQPRVIERARVLNIRLLHVPRGLTSKYQPLDVGFNGVFKRLMKTYWLNHQFNENKKDTCKNMITTIITAYQAITNATVISSFRCMNF